MASRAEILRASRARFRECLPEMERPWCVAALSGGVVLACGVLLVTGHRIARPAPARALVVQGGFALWGLVWMYGGFWRRRAAYRERYGARAYRQLFYRFLLPGLSGALPALFFPVLAGGDRLLPPAVAWALAAYLLLTAHLIEWRGTEIFWDLELRTFVWSVFPERGRVVTGSVFRWLRHPIYSSMMRFTCALGLARNTGAAVACAALAAAALFLLGRLEECELERRAPGYADYRRRVPAVVATHPVRFWRFLLAGDGGRDR